MDTRGFEFDTELEQAPISRAKLPDCCAVVIFGATGDLSKRKLVPALYNLAVDGALPRRFAVLGVSRTVLPADGFRAELRASTERFSRTRPLDDKVWEAFARRIETCPGSLDDLASFERVRETLEQVDRDHGTCGNRLYYFATPPKHFAQTLGNLRDAGLLADPRATERWTRVIIEKPFGRDLASARELNRIATDILDESQIFRIDHYLGKETVQNILVFRFGNAIFEQMWNRRSVDHVQITAAEEIGIERRGKFYDETGVMRDFVQNHLLQVLALCAMEQPVSFRADDIRDEKAKVLRSLRPIAESDVASHVVRAQYQGYRSEEGVSPDSTTPTFVAMKAFIDNWRWQGVPFYIRAGKSLHKRITEVSFHFHPVPFCLFGRDEVCQLLQPNVLTLRIQPDEGIFLRFNTKVPGDDLSVSAVRMDFNYARAFDRPPQDAYERLLVDCMRGDATLFSRKDSVELAWSFVDPILDTWEHRDPDVAGPLALYEPGSQGPAQADRFIAVDGRRWDPIR